MNRRYHFVATGLLAMSGSAAPVTWNNCVCKETWKTDEGQIQEFCSNPDDDPKGTWCKVRDPKCEDSDWGYCKPEGACLDETWRDSQGYSCIEYSQRQYCTKDGGYGRGWDESWGTFLDYADFQGRTAKTACCSCGGGKTSRPRVMVNDFACFDLNGWRDSEGDTCATYESRGWCTPHGDFGPGWHKEWGPYSSFTSNNLSIPGPDIISSHGRNQVKKSLGNPFANLRLNATRACCACGGGITRSVMPIKSAWLKAHADVQKENFKKISLMARQTWNDCRCKKSWNVSKAMEAVSTAFAGVPLLPLFTSFMPQTCDSYCCNKDKDPYGQWCLVEDKHCEDANWGYCRPPPSIELSGQARANQISAMTGPIKFRQCEDTLAWTDSDGDTCDDYARHMWCTTKGEEGPGWHQEWGKLSDFGMDHRPANQHCCACGKQSTFGLQNPFKAKTLIKATAIKMDVLNQLSRGRETYNRCKCKKQWKDTTSGRQCDSYCCNFDNDVNGQWCMVEAPSCEDNDWGYCRPLDLNIFRSKETCSDAPRNFKDNKSQSCAMYKEKKLCNATGGYGPGWSAKWGNFEDLANADGMTGYSACCSCGGGARQPAMMHCMNIPNWVDKEGDTCDMYYSMKWCNPMVLQGRRYGPGWQEAWGTFEDFEGADGLTAIEACCACGGGLVVQQERYSRMQIVEELVNSTYGLIIIIPLIALCCGCCVVGAVVLYCFMKKNNVTVQELPATATHVARKYGKFDDGSI